MIFDHFWGKIFNTKCIEEFYKLLNNFSHYTYHFMFLNYTIIIDSILDIMYLIYLTTKTYNKNNLSNKKKENKIDLYVVHPHVHTLIAGIHWF